VNAFSRRGACPALSAPMQTGDGLLVRLNPLDAGLSPGMFAELCEAALRHGNGVVEVTGRGSLQIRGLTPQSAVLLAGDVERLGLAVRTGLPVEHGALAGLDPEEIADPRPLAGRIREAAGKAELERRLGPKVSVVVEGGGRSGLGAVTADVRLTAVRRSGGIWWTLAIAGDARTARPLATLPEAGAAASALACLEAIATLGREGRGRDLDAGQLARLVAPLQQPAGAPPPAVELPTPTPSPSPQGGGELGAAHPAFDRQRDWPKQRQRRPPPPCGEGSGVGVLPYAQALPPFSDVAGGQKLVPSILSLRGGTSALAVAMPFGQMDANGLAGLAASAEEAGASEIRLAPSRTVLALCPSEAAAETLRDEAARLGFLVEAADPRAGIAACPGAPACASGRIRSRHLAARIAGTHGDILDGSLDVHVSGCAKGCAHPAGAALTLVGSDGGAGLVLGGSARGAPAAAVPAAHALHAFGRIAGLLRAERRPGETTAACAARLGQERLAEAFEKG